jgi:hypothetical protein
MFKLSKEREMKKSFFVLLVLFAAILAASGCSRANCEKIEEACGGGDDVVDDCIDDYKDGDADCRKAIRDFADCVDDNGCDDSCNDEAMDVVNEC